MTEIDPTKETIGLTPEGLIIICCDCPDENAGCYCIPSVRVISTMSMGVQTHCGPAVFSYKIDVDYWTGREPFVGVIDGGPSGTNPSQTNMTYHEPDPVFLASRSQGLASASPEIIDGGLGITQALRDALYPNDPTACKCWNYIRVTCFGWNKIDPPEDLVFGIIPKHKTQAASAWNTSFISDVPDTECLQLVNQTGTGSYTKYSPSFNADSWSGDWEWSSGGGLTNLGTNEAASNATQATPTYMMGNGNLVYSPSIGQNIPSGLPWYTYQQDDEWNGYEHACPPPPDEIQTRTFGHRAIRNEYLIVTAKRVPRAALVSWGGFEAVVPVFLNSDGWTAVLGLRIFNGWDSGQSHGEGGAMDEIYYQAVSQTSQNYALGGMTPGTSPFVGGPPVWDATPFQGNPVFNWDQYRWDFLPAMPCAGWMRVSWKVWETNNTQIPNVPAGWYGSVWSEPWVGFAEKEYTNINQANPNYPDQFGDLRQWFYNFQDYDGTLDPPGPILPDEEISFVKYGVSGRTDMTFDPETGGGGTIPYYVVTNRIIGQVPTNYTKHYLDWSIDFIY